MKKLQGVVNKLIGVSQPCFIEVLDGPDTKSIGPTGPPTNAIITII